MPSSETRSSLKWLALALACLTAGAYVLIGTHILGVGDLQPSDVPAAIVFVAASCYLVGGLLILLRWRWLWVAGAVVNVLVILIFVLAYLARPDVMFSVGGLVSKAAQVLLELNLLVLIITDWRRPAAQSLGLTTGMRLP